MNLFAPHRPPTVRHLPGRHWPQLPEHLCDWCSPATAAAAELFEVLDDRHAPHTTAGSRVAALPVSHLPTLLPGGPLAQYVLLLFDGRLVLEHLQQVAQPLRGCFLNYRSGAREYVPTTAVRQVWRVLYWCHPPAGKKKRLVEPAGKIWPYSDN